MPLVRSECDRLPADSINPFTAPACKIYGHAYKQYIFHSSNICFQCNVFRWQSLHMPVGKKKTNSQGFQTDFVLLLVIFKWHHGSEGVRYRCSCAIRQRNGTADFVKRSVQMRSTLELNPEATCAIRGNEWNPGATGTAGTNFGCEMLNLIRARPGPS